MKIFNKKNKKNRGMSYVELIVVLSIFSIMSSIVLFNYRDFQSQVEIKSLANNIALKITQAQKEAMSGKTTTVGSGDSWQPSYGLFFGKNSPKNFIYFADLDNSALSSEYAYNTNSSACDGYECLDTINLNNNYNISNLRVYCNNADVSGSVDVVPGPVGISTVSDTVGGSAVSKGGAVDSMSVTFTRPDSKAYIQSNPDAGCLITSAIISLSSGNSTSNVKIYSSGRIQIN